MVGRQYRVWACETTGCPQLATKARACSLHGRPMKQVTLEVVGAPKRDYWDEIEALLPIMPKRMRRSVEDLIGRVRT